MKQINGQMDFYFSAYQKGFSWGKALKVVDRKNELLPLHPENTALDLCSLLSGHVLSKALA